MFLHTTKYDGRLHYRFPVELVARTEHSIATYRTVDVPMESYRGPRVSPYHLLCVHWNDRPWNLCVHWERDWRAREMYVNIATPASWTAEVVTCVDLDLDLILPAPAPAPGESQEQMGPVLVDEDEFAEHRGTMGYPEALVQTCWKTTRELLEKMQRGEGVFDGRLYAWRPGQGVEGLM